MSTKFTSAIILMLLLSISQGLSVVIIDDWIVSMGLVDGTSVPQSTVFNDSGTGLSGTLQIGGSIDTFEANGGGDELGGASAGSTQDTIDNGEVYTFTMTDATWSLDSMLTNNWNSLDSFSISAIGYTTLNFSGASDAALIDISSFSNIAPGVAATITDTSTGGNGWTIDDLTFSIVAIPEPSTVALLLMGGVGLVALRRGRKN
jgi:hypothetical protein